MKTEELIKNLSNDLKPVKPHPGVLTLFIRWCIALLISLFLGMALFGIRPDISEALFDANFLFQTSLLLITAIASAVTVFLLSVPGLEPTRFVKVIPILTTALWIVTIVASLLGASELIAGKGFNCIRDLLVLGAAPGLLLFTSIRAAAPFKLTLSGFLIALSVAATGAFGTQFLCRNEDPLHLFVWHFLPLIAVSMLGCFLGRKILRKV